MSAVIAPEHLRPGFADPVHDSQAAFRALLAALSRPGHVVDLDTGPDSPPPPLMPATAAVALSLLDSDTPVWLDPGADRPAVRDFLRFHCGCPLVTDSLAARFAIIVGAPHMPGLDHFDAGGALYPEHSATLIVQVASVRGHPDLKLSGPGIQTRHQVGVNGLPHAFWETWRHNGARYPQGVDLVLAGPDGLVGLPRTTRVEVF